MKTFVYWAHLASTSHTNPRLHGSYFNCCGFSSSLCMCTAGTTLRTGFFGQGSGGIFSVSVSESGSIVPTEEEKCSHDNDAALFCLGTFQPAGQYIKRIAAPPLPLPKYIKGHIPHRNPYHLPFLNANKNMLRVVISFRVVSAEVEMNSGTQLHKFRVNS